MRLFIVRHGYAGNNENPPGTPDPNLPLTSEGREAIEALAQWMSANGYEPKVIVASPLKRAQQTAQILRKAFDVPKVITEDGLGPRKPLQMIVRKLAADEDMKRVAIVSHHDSIAKGLGDLNGVDDVDPIAMAELRCLTLDRDSCNWEEDGRVLPSDLGLIDFY